MAKPLQLGLVTVLLRRTTPLPTTIPPPRFLFTSSNLSIKPLHKQPFSTTSTPCPLQYEMIISRPNTPPPPPPHRHRLLPPHSHPQNSNTPHENNISFNDFVDERLNKTTKMGINEENDETESENLFGMDKKKRKYYNKRRKRMLGSDSEDEEYRTRGENEFVELKQEVVELKTLHKREEELYFYDAFAYPWEKDKHYKMVYQLEKKYFPGQGFDKAFLDPGKRNADERKPKRGAKSVLKGTGESGGDEGLVFFEDKGGESGRGNVERKSERVAKSGEGTGESGGDKGLVFFEDKRGEGEDVKVDVSEKKVGEFFKCLKKVPNEDAQPEAFLSSKRTGLPAQWDSPAGTVLLVNKPKGWTSFTVCGKLRRLVKVKKVGHAGTLDPMATGLLIVCVGKSTKIVDRYQGMTKGYSGIFRLGEATSTWDADSPVIQREPWEHIKDGDLKKAAESFCGEIWQVPPMFSAIKVGGEKLYEKARRGESLELSPRRISIFQFDIERSLDDRQNVIFRVICSKGTYIRSLCADLGKALGSCAHLTALRRDSIGEYLADDAWDFKELEEEIVKGYM